ncbi:uncharacterized protein BCR38DRAFT_413020 [Pseudomassariella vexata]|uniref:Uncharacterized protein n=1 Tax=Pseudomassariella vexata TaxID=1141098 RepID=A0A1Y2DJC0_9PEZI|nr:uncharacterized protein BCR38DRAFT_413020 [Pseudomassariella vexata]ORY59327.1 hypothetical protein BCR38DRAFT_413020 [Pseudomassariella vexata]
MADETDYEHESALSTDKTYAEHTQNISDNEKLILWLNGVTQDEDTQQGLYSSQWDIPSEAIPYMGFSPEMIENFGLIISSNGRQRVQVHQIEYYYILPEYTHTRSTGIATFVHVAKPLLPDNPTPQEISAAFTKIKTQIEFSLGNGNGNGRYNITSLKFLHSNRKLNQAWHMPYKCSDIRVCGHVHPKVTSYTEEYNRVDVSQIRNIVRELPKPTLSSIQQMLKEAIENQYNAFLQLWQAEGTAPCQPFKKDRYPRCCKGQRLTVFYRNRIPFIGCPKNSDGEPWHTAWSLPSYKSSIDIAYLRALCESCITGEKDQCVWIGRPEQKRQYYGT